MIIPNIYIYVYIYTVYIKSQSSHVPVSTNQLMISPGWSHGGQMDTAAIAEQPLPFWGFPKKNEGFSVTIGFKTTSSATLRLHRYRVPPMTQDTSIQLARISQKNLGSWKLVKKTTEDSPVSKRCDAMATCANPKHTSTTKLHISSYINHINETQFTNKTAMETTMHY